ncbi:lipid II:glycine glycyltransferase FemX [Patescibacteria group bacterium]
MEIKEIENRDVWENFLLMCENKTFLDSWNWGEFQKAIGNKVLRLGIYIENELLGAALILKITARRGTFLFCPHGPAVSKDNIQNSKEILEALTKELKKTAKKEKAAFVRISPVFNENKESIFKNLGYRRSPIHMHPELTWQLDISLPEEKLLQNMRKTTRYLIRQVEKNPEVNIRQSDKLEDVEKFNELYQKTVNRHHFTPFSIEYLKNEVSSFLPDNISVFLGEYKKELVASSIIIFWQGTAYYHQGASSQKYPKIPVSYLLQWEAIKEAKKRGCRTYNFWGITDSQSKKHPWAGLTLFKKGFGGYQKKYVKTQDLPLSFGYWINFLIEKARKLKRGL